MRRSVGVIGTGAMGGAVAARLVERGWTVHTRDIRPEADAAARAVGARVEASPAAVARACGVVVTLVVDAIETELVLFGPDGVVGAMAPGGLVILASTIDPLSAADLGRRVTAAGLGCLDAPVSGGPNRARDGTMSMMVGGSMELLETHGDLFADMAGPLFVIGETVGDGAKMKVVNNMIAAATLAAGCEGMALAMRMGLDPALVYDVVQASSGASFVFDTRLGRMVRGDRTVHAATRILAKDVALALGAAKRAGSPAPLAELTARVFRDTLAMGLGEADDGAILAWFRDGPPARG